MASRLSKPIGQFRTQSASQQQSSSESNPKESKLRDYRTTTEAQIQFAALLNSKASRVKTSWATMEDSRKERVTQGKFASLIHSSSSNFLGKPAGMASEGMTSGTAVIQREVFKSRKQGKWYTDRDPDQLFDTKEEAQLHQNQLIIAELEERDVRKREIKDERIKKRKREFEEEYGDYKPPKSKRVRLFKNQDKDFDDVKLSTLGPKNVKKFMEVSIKQRKADLFKTQTINLGGDYFVLAPGTDIGLTPAMLRPDLKMGHKLVPLSREGKAKPYTELARGLDQLAGKKAKRTFPLNEVRERIGKDLMRLTRGNPVRGIIKYTQKELKLLNEIAAVLRLDKGRVPKATKYIRKRITQGDLSFHELFVEAEYVGAGVGGVKALRGKVEDDGEFSEGSDME